MKQFNNLTIGVDIRNIGKKRTGDEVVFFNLVKTLAFIGDTNPRMHTNATNKRKIKFLLFTDIIDTALLYSNVVKPLGIEGREDFEIVSLGTPTLNPSPKGGGGIGMSKFIWNAWTLPRYLRKHPVDVYHTQYITPFFVPGKIKIITHIHDVSFKAYKQFIRWSDLFFLKILIPLSLKRADKIIAVSKFTRNEIIKYYKVNPEKVEMVYNAVSNKHYSLTPTLSQRERERMRKKYNLPEKFILYIGTLQPRKNIPMLIKAYMKIKDRIPGIKLVIAGNKEAYNVDKRIDETIRKDTPLNPPSKRGEGIRRDDIIFPGFIDEKDKLALFRSAHLFVFPSLYEGFGIPILEAMGQNVPVAASDIPSLSEVGSSAYLKFNPRDLDEMAEKLYTACVDKDLRNKLINLGQSRVRFFSWKKTAERMLEIYKNLASYRKF